MDFCEVVSAELAANTAAWDGNVFGGGSDARSVGDLIADEFRILVPRQACRFVTQLEWDQTAQPQPIVVPSENDPPSHLQATAAAAKSILMGRAARSTAGGEGRDSRTRAVLGDMSNAPILHTDTGSAPLPEDVPSLHKMIQDLKMQLAASERKGAHWEQKEKMTLGFLREVATAVTQLGRGASAVRAAMLQDMLDNTEAQFMSIECDQTMDAFRHRGLDLDGEPVTVWQYIMKHVEEDGGLKKDLLLDPLDAILVAGGTVMGDPSRIVSARQKVENKHKQANSHVLVEEPWKALARDINKLYGSLLLPVKKKRLVTYRQFVDLVGHLVPKPIKDLKHQLAWMKQLQHEMPHVEEWNIPTFQATSSMKFKNETAANRQAMVAIELEDVDDELVE